MMLCAYPKHFVHDMRINAITEGHYVVLEKKFKL